MPFRPFEGGAGGVTALEGGFEEGEIMNVYLETHFDIKFRE